MIKISEYTTHEKEEVKEMINECLKEIYRMPHPNDQWENFNSYQIGGGIFYTMKENGRIIGSVALINNGRYGILKRMYLRKEYRGEGLSQKLLGKILSFARRKKLKRIDLTTTKEMKRAHTFYKKYGFVLVRETPLSLTFSMRLSEKLSKND